MILIDVFCLLFSLLVLVIAIDWANENGLKGANLVIFTGLSLTSITLFIFSLCALFN
jgi:TRAP-type C4-dicarboxylate transport system permease small subunit